MKWTIRSRSERAIVGHDARLEQACRVGVDVESVAETLCEPLVECAVVTANQAEHIRELLIARERTSQKMTSAFASFESCLWPSVLVVFSHRSAPPRRYRRDRAVLPDMRLS